MISVRYIVDDAPAGAAFYRDRLGFDIQAQPAPGFAILTRDGMRLLLSEPSGPGGAAQAMPDGRRPEPGGWNRIQIEVEDVTAEADALKRAGVRFRNEVVRGRGGAQVLLEDPAGNPVELFERAR